MSLNCYIKGAKKWKPVSSFLLLFLRQQNSEYTQEYENMPKVLRKTWSRKQTPKRS
jgi:hypothetical protein